MGTIFLDPTNNVNYLWYINTVINIDNGVRTPTVPGTDYIEARDTDDNEIQHYFMSDTTLPSGYKVITAKLWAYGRTVTSPSPWGQILSALASKDLGFTGTNGWHYVEWTGLNYTSQLDVDLMYCKLDSKTMPEKAITYVYGVYIELTTELIVTTDIKEVMGVPYADIKEIDGVPIADVKEFDGVA